MKKHKSDEPLFVIRAYCTDCKKLIMESNPLTRRQLIASWDKAVTDAPGIACSCSPKRVPNFHIDLKIYHKGINKEFKPEQILPKPVNAPDMETEGVPEWMLNAMKNCQE